jgi:hypothetical protein
MIEDEEFFAWLDGELELGAASRVAAQVAASPELTAKAEAHRRLGAGLHGAFDPVLEHTALPHFQRAEVIDFGSKATERERRRGWFSAPQWAAMAASLAIGLVVGTQWVGRSGIDSPVTVEGGQLVAAAALDKALDTRLASTGAPGIPRMGLTFRDATGRICRSFTDASASGLACREGGSWHVRGLYPTAEGQAGKYRMAAGEDPHLATLIDETIVGEPFDAAQEKAALDAGWR